MWTKNTSRGELLDLLQAERPLSMRNSSQYDLLNSDSHSDLQIAWKEKPSQESALPRAIIVPHNKKRDFLAWALTYLTNFRPFTAYFRIFTKEDVEKYTIEQEPSLGKLESVCLGIILGEAATYLDTHDIRQLSPSGCSRTFSFAMSRALALGLLKNEGNADMANAWQMARHLTNQPKLNLNVEYLLIPWSVILLLADIVGIEKDHPPQNILDACRDLFNKGDIEDSNWMTFVSTFPEHKDVLTLMRGTREERVVTFEKMFNMLLPMKNKDETTCAFLCGYLASLIAPGAIDHLNLLRPYVRELPSILLWYGLCTGLRNHSSMKNYSLGLGRRILRDLLQYEFFIDRPRCDISLAELELLVVDNKMTLDFRTGRSGQMEIEIAPCVTTTVKWPPPSDHQQELHMRSEIEYEIADLEADVTLALAKMENVRRRLSHLTQIRASKSTDIEQKYRKGKKKGR
ncbi:MAG TPA: hypothetical protein DDW27_03760 [Bacteroidales bacterium]|nr:hypothetical protein [Bacteroidales bacterium]